MNRAATRARRRPSQPLVGPSVRAAPLGAAASGAITQLLTERQRHQLASVASRLQLPRKMILFREDSPATSIWIVGTGVVKAFRALPRGKRQIMAFLFASDVFGLAQNGRYVNTTQSVTPVTLYRIPFDTLVTILRRDSELEFQFLCKVAHELRELQRRALIVGRRDAPGRLAMFVSMLARNTRHDDTGQRPIPVPMSRLDIAEYLNLTPEALSRASRRLARNGIISFTDRHTVQITNRARFDELVNAL